MVKSKLLKGTIILSITSLFVRIISLSYDILLYRILGAEGTGILQMIMSVLMIFLIITTSGIPTALSKLVASKKSINDYIGIKRTFKISLFFTFTVSSLLSLGLILNAKYISNVFNNKFSIINLYTIAPAIIIISITSVIRGYLYGLNKMITASISEIIEHISRFIIVIGLFYFLNQSSSELKVMIAVIGITIGELIDLLFLITISTKKHKNTSSIIYSNKKNKSIFKQILVIVVPLTLLGIISTSSIFINSILIPKQLIKSGLSATDAIKTFGRVVGMTLPLIYLPNIFTSAIVINIIPSLSSQLRLKQYKSIKKDLALSIKLTLIVSSPIAATFIYFSKPISILLYNDILVSNSLKIMSFGILFLSLQHTFSGLLNGFGKQIKVTINRVIGMSIQLICIITLVKNPNFSINGYYIGFLVSITIITLLDLIALKKEIKFSFHFSYLLNIILSTFTMIFVSSSIYAYLSFSSLNQNISIIISIIMGFIFYIITLYFTKLLPLKDYESITKF